LTDNTKMYWLQTITPLHIGAGKGVGFVDMPIMREKVTEWPLVPGSAVKGVMRDHFRQKKIDESTMNTVFGRLVSDDSSNAGSLVLTDAHIVCLPVRSLYGTFAYVTSPLVLERLRRDLDAAGYEELPETPSPKKEQAFCAKQSSLFPEEAGGTEKKIFLEDLDFAATYNDAATAWAERLAGMLFSDTEKWQTIFKERFTILPDDNFTFLAKTGTEVAAHIRIKDETKTVDKGGLWYEESLPAETILAGLAWCDRVFGNGGLTEEEILDKFCPASGLNLQIGGKATVGKGRVKCFFTGG
jgi:CRISPR-associated protein Cmr4